MFGFIRNIFRNKPEAQQDDQKWFHYADFSAGEWEPDFRHPAFSTTHSKRTENLTQRDLQMLIHIVSMYIQVADIVRKEIKEEALEYEVGDDLRSVLFGEHRKVKDYLKKLSALQYRLKHKIAVGG